MKEVIHEEVLNRIKDYTNLTLGNSNVVTPYFINDKRRKDLRAMVGKGTPEEIIMEAKIWEKLKGAKFSSLDSQEIKQFLSDRGIGIDCSGFIVHILDAYTQKVKGRHLWSYLKLTHNGIINSLRYMLRPVEQLGANIITDTQNCNVVSISEVQPMDLIRSRSTRLNGDHIMIVIEVERNQEGVVKKITYAHSTPHFGKDNGVKFGEIEIIDETKTLELQNWMEKDSSGLCPTLDGYKMDSSDNGLRRLKFLSTSKP